MWQDAWVEFKCVLEMSGPVVGQVMGSLKETSGASRKGTPPVSSAMIRHIRASLGGCGGHRGPFTVGLRTFQGQTYPSKRRN